ncbi:hypothetical protein Ancab_006964 [Ancistrocladus abbreviatus]
MGVSNECFYWTISLSKHYIGNRMQLSASGESRTPEVVADPLGEVAKTFHNHGVCVVQQCDKIRQQSNTHFS